MPRLRHRLYNVDCGVSDGRRSFGGSAALVGVAAVGLLALFWLPFAASVPLEMELPAVSAQYPPPGSGEPPSLFRSGPFVTTLLLEDESSPGRISHGVRVAASSTVAFRRRHRSFLPQVGARALQPLSRKMRVDCGVPRRGIA